MVADYYKEMNRCTNDDNTLLGRMPPRPPPTGTYPGDGTTQEVAHISKR